MGNLCFIFKHKIIDGQYRVLVFFVETVCVQAGHVNHLCALYEYRVEIMAFVRYDD